MIRQVRQYGIFLTGLFVVSLGVAFSTKAGLGTSPVASVPYSVSLANRSLTFGQWLIALSLLQITLQVLLLRKQCKPFEIAVQLAVAFVYGNLTDFSCGLLSGVNPVAYPARFVLMLLGCAIVGLGIWIQYKGSVAMMPGEALNRAVSQVSGKRFEDVKILMDVLYILIAAVICLVFAGRLEGVREGSIVAALLIGNMIRLYNRIFDRLVQAPAEKRAA